MAKASKIIRCVLLMCLVSTLIINGCANTEITDSNVASKEFGENIGLIDGKSLSQFILTKYLNLYDFSEPMSQFLLNIKDFSSTRGTDFDAVILYVLDNIHQLIDEALLNEIISQANQVYDVDDAEPINLTEIVQQYFDVRGEYGGINLIGHDVNSSIMKLEEYFLDTSLFTFQEQEHLVALLEALSGDNVSIETILSTLIQDEQNPIFSDEYKMFLSYAIHSSTFYTSNALGLLPEVKKTLIAVDIIVTNPSHLNKALPGETKCKCETGGSCTNQSHCKFCNDVTALRCECFGGKAVGWVYVIVMVAYIAGQVSQAIS